MVKLLELVLKGRGVLRGLGREGTKSARKKIFQLVESKTKCS